MISSNNKTKSVVTVTEMARMVGLSRARFYQLIGSAFPQPQYHAETKRPYYTEEQQLVCLEVRRRNCGVDGKPILFYSRRGGETSKRKVTKKAKQSAQYKEIVSAVRSLGLSSVDSKQVAKVIDELFPKGIAGIDQSEVIRAVFVQIQRNNSTDSQCR